MRVPHRSLRARVRHERGTLPRMPPRHLRLRVLEALEQRVKQFRTREDLYPLRVPRDPISLDEVIVQALPDDHCGFDPATLRSRTLLTMQWGTLTWEAWVITLPSGVKLYCDSDVEETRVLASGGRNAGDESDRLFLQLLSESGGEEFGIEMSGGAPSRVRSSINDRAFLVELFVNLFEVTNAEASVRHAVAAWEGEAAAVISPRPPGDSENNEDNEDHAGGSDFRTEVERWLQRVCH